MKVGVLTFHRASNFGTALQAYATVEALKAQGIDAELIDYRPDYIERTVRVRQLRRAGSIKEGASIFLNRLIYGRQQEQKIQRFLDFAAALPCGKVCGSQEELAKASACYDVILSGSDQLWNERITGKDLSYFFPFPHPKKVSFASSFGVSHLSDERQAEICPLLNDFQTLCVREETALHLVRALPGMTEKPIHRVVDPTLLLDANTWKQQAASVELPKDGYILTYYMIETPVLRAITEKLRNLTGLPVVNLKPSKRQILCREGLNMMWAGPREFLSCYAGAKYVVTNSFHGTAFAINFGVPLYVAPLPFSMAGEVNSRLVEILQWYGLSQRWIENLDNVDETVSDNAMDLSADILRNHRDASLEILNAMLS